ncbi:nucleoside hydrolase [Leptospira sp. 96542]|nr:nucleoside hydrolase [Leptospira sp. 96542]
MAQNRHMPHKLILDIDPGLDDALALAFAHARREFELLAVTTSFGRVALPQATRNALRLCVGTSNIPSENKNNLSPDSRTKSRFSVIS